MDGTLSGNDRNLLKWIFRCQEPDRNLSFCPPHPPCPVLSIAGLAPPASRFVPWPPGFAGAYNGITPSQ